ncbi:MAG: ABC transporter permease [Proteobacteria bacterium]|nr:ABC transporter permease [Pseudomonadota bacterium]
MINFLKSIFDTLRLSSLVALRHWLIFRRNFFANISPTIVDPFLYVLVFGAWLGTQVQSFGPRSYLEFMAPGIAAMSALFTAFFEGSYGFYVRLVFENVFKALMTTPVGPREILLGELIWLGSKAAIMASFVSLVLVILGVAKPNYLFLVPFMGVLVGVSCGAIGLVACTFVKNVNQFQAIYAWIISPMFFVSGMFVPISSMPYLVQKICWLSPFFHGVQLFQATLWADNVLSAWVTHGSILFVMASCLAAWMWRRIFPILYG